MGSRLFFRVLGPVEPWHWRPPHLNTTPLPWSIPLLCGASSADVFPVAETLEEADSSSNDAISDDESDEDSDGDVNSS